jgi:hypothetical protein
MEDAIALIGIGTLMMLPLIAGGITFVLSHMATEPDDE